jgi:tetratricopeptide (TPR) repeat protein
MSSSDWLASANSSDPLGLTAAYQNAQTNRVQLAQYSIAQASTYWSAGKNDQAITAFKKALVFDPNNTSAYNSLGQIYLSQGNTTDAIKSYKQLVRIQSNPSTVDTSTNAPTQEAATLGLANAYLQAKQYVQSEQQYKAAAKLKPTDPVPPYTLGQQYLTQGRLSEALTMFQKTQKLSPSDGNVYYALGSVYNAQGNYNDAATALQTSIQLKPNFPSANYQLGIAYNGLGDSDGVQQQLSILNSSDTNLASQLQSALKPKITGMDASNPLNTFNETLSSNTQLLIMDPTKFIVPNSSATLSAVIQFDSGMDFSSVTNAANWKISMGNNPQSGFYNNTMPLSSTDVSIVPTPLSVTYDSNTEEATVNFQLSQNSKGNATIDPQHVVFTFDGADAAGQNMDQTANSIDGSAVAGFGSVDYFA